MSTVLNGELTRVEEKMLSVTHSAVQLLQETTQHTIMAGGKRLRPQLLFLAYRAAGGQNPDEAAPLAAALELVHTATLVHDDINDHSLMRRGKMTVRAQWGRTFALLTGDYLFAKVYEMMAPYGATYNQIMSTACVRLVEGETLQAAAAKSGKLDRETYKQIIALKTATLFEAAAYMGGLLGGGDDISLSALRQYGYNLGLAFQIVDDLLDLVGDTAKMGKDAGIDLSQHRGILAVQPYDPLLAMMSKLRNAATMEMARAEAGEMGRRARQALADLPLSPARVELDRLIDAVLDRQK